MADDVGESYRSSLSDLKFNSKPLINMLTMLAEEEEQNAPQIVQAIEQHIEQVKTAHKLPVLYLIDSIIKNLTSTLYPKLFAQNIVQMFCSVFEEVDEKTRGQMFKLRQTWKDILPNKKLYALDVRVNMADPAWPITAHAPEQTTIHVNPKFLIQQMEEKAAVGRFSPPIASPPPTDEEELMRRQLIAKEQELQKMRLELELAETKAKLHLQRKQLEDSQKAQKVDSDRSIWQALQMNPLTSSSTSTPTSEPKQQPATKRDPRLASRDPRKARSQAQMASANKAKTTPVAIATPSLQPTSRPNVSASLPHGMNVAPSGLPSMNAQVPQNVTSMPNFPPSFPTPLPAFMNTGIPPLVFPPAFSGTAGKPQSLDTLEPPKVLNPPQVSISKIAAPSKSLSGNESATKAQSVNKSSDKPISPIKKEGSKKMTQKKDGDKILSTSVKENDKKNHENSNKSESSDIKLKGKDSKTKEQSKSRSRSPRDKHGNDKSKEPKFRHERKSSKDSERDRRPGGDYSRRRQRDTEHFSRKDRGKGTFRGHRNGDSRHGDFDRGKHRDSHEVNDRSPRRSRSPGGDRLHRDRERNHNHDKEKTDKKDTKLDQSQMFMKTGQKGTESELQMADLPIPPIPPFGILADMNKVAGVKTATMNNPTPPMEMPLDVLLPKEAEKQVRPSKRSSEHLDIDERNVSAPGDGPTDKRQRMGPLKLQVPKPSADLSDLFGDLFGGEDVDYRKSSGPLSMKSPMQNKWNSFKASHPDEYGPEMEKSSSKNTTPDEVVDIDMRKMHPLSPFTPSHQKPNAPPLHPLSIPNALHLDHQEDILIQASKQLESGKMSHDQHQNLLKQLSQVYDLQRRELKSPVSGQNQPSALGKLDEVRHDPRLASRNKLSNDAGSRDQRFGAKTIASDHVPGQSPKQDIISDAVDTDHRKMSSGKLEKTSVDGDISAHEKEIQPKEGLVDSNDTRLNKDNNVVPTDVDDRLIKNDKIDELNDTRQADKVTPKMSEVPPDIEVNKENPSVPMSKDSTIISKKETIFEPPKVNDLRIPEDVDSRPPISADPKSPVDKDFRQPLNIHSKQQINTDLDSVVPIDKDHRVPTNRYDRDRSEKGNWPLADGNNQVPMHSNDQENRPQMGGTVRHPLDKDHRMPYDQNRNPMDSDDRFWPNKPREFSEDLDFRHPASEFVDRDFRHDSRSNRGDMHRHSDRRHQERFDHRSLPPRNDTSRPDYDGPEGRRDIRDDRNFRDSRPIFSNDKRTPLMHPNQDNFHADYQNSPISKPVETRSDPDMYDDPRWVTMRGMTNAEVLEEVVIDKRPYEIKVGGQPRKIRLGPGRSCLLYVDPNKRGVIIDGKLLYRFGEPVKDVNINGKMVKLFFHGLSRLFWIDGHQYQLRIDAPPKRIVIDGAPYGFQIDGRDMMILVDRLEKGTFCGPPREIILNNKKHEIRFDPLPREILIDGQFCELKLDRRIPVVIYKGRPHGIRFDGPPRTVLIDDFPFIVPMDNAVKVKIKNRPHFLAFGGPAHEIVIDGKWFEVKFDGIAREIVLGSNTHLVRLEGPCPTVKILDEVPIGYEEMMKMPLPPREQVFRPQGSEVPVQGRMEGPIRPDGFVQRPMGPNHDGMMQGPRGPGPNMMMQGPRGPGLDGMNQMQNVLPAGPMQQAGLMPQQGGMTQLGAAGMQQGLGLQGLNPLVSQQMQMQSQIPGAMMMAGIQNLNQLQLQQQLLPVSLGGLGIGGLLQQNALATTTSLGVPNVLSSLLPTAVTTPVPAPTLDVSSLFQKLLASGIIKKSEPANTTETKVEPKTEESTSSEEQKFKIPEIEKEVIEKIPPLTLSKFEDFKKTYKGVVQELYTGLQCTSCGERFSFSQTDRYREHLDWHFRKNKRGMDDMKVARNRDWYFKINEWIQYQEIEESEERGRSRIFDQMMQNTPMETSSLSVSLPQGSIVDKCPAASDVDGGDICCICGDPFDQYWNEEKEDWHLRDAIRVEQKIYHPVCYEDAREEGSIIEPTPTPTTDPQVDPLTLQIRSQGAKDSTVSSVSVTTEPDKSDSVIAVTIKQEPVTESQNDVTVKSCDVSSVIVKQEPGTVPQSDILEKSDKTASVVVKQEPKTVSQSNVSETVNVVSVVVKQEPISNKAELLVSEAVQQMPVRTELALQEKIGSLQTTQVKMEVVTEPVKTEPKEDVPT